MKNNEEDSTGEYRKDPAVLSAESTFFLCFCYFWGAVISKAPDPFPPAVNLISAAGSVTLF